MAEQSPAGFKELEHTADWELMVWGPDLSNLFIQAARGMYQLSGIQLSSGSRQVRQINLHAADPESLLVSFLDELLFWGENEGLGIDEFDLRIRDTSLQGRVWGAPIAHQEKEIKAVTYHNLNIQQRGPGLQVTIVFDV